MCALRVHVCAHPGCTQSAGSGGGAEMLSFSKNRVPEIQCNHLWKVVSAYRVVVIIIKKILMDNVILLQFIILCQINCDSFQILGNLLCLWQDCVSKI